MYYDGLCYKVSTRGASPEYGFYQQELDTWRKNYLNVNVARERMLDLQNRNKWLRDEIDRLQIKVKVGRE